MSGRLAGLLDAIGRDGDCSVGASGGQPAVGRPIPGDLREFYELCGGVELFRSANYPWVISGVDQLVATNPVVIGTQVEDDITSTWYVIAREGGDSSALISIDLGLRKPGWCYDSDWEVHGVAGSCAVLSHSFTDLLEALYLAKGDYLFWGSTEFAGLGDAYDE
jgi:hypothetical protein